MGDIQEGIRRTRTRNTRRSGQYQGYQQTQNKDPHHKHGNTSREFWDNLGGT